MTRKEIIDFLSLPENVSTEKLLLALDEKVVFFNSLRQNAPTSLLKKVYERNIDQLKEYKLFLDGQTDNKDVLRIETNEPQPIAKKSVSSAESNKSQTNASESAWLIRHTENSSTISFPLKEGINKIGRKTEANYVDVDIENDKYISRKHAIIEIVNHRCTIYDFSELNSLPSKNGIYINGNESRLQGKYLLKDGDTIQLGKTKLVFKANSHKPISDVEDEVSHSEYMRTVVINVL